MFFMTRLQRLTFLLQKKRIYTYAQSSH